MDFYDSFIYFIDLTRSKIIKVANEISYDRSYLSKWYNRKSLPNREVWPEIRDSLGKYFASVMTEENIDDFVSLKPSIACSLEYSSLEDVLISFLDDAYAFSIRIDEEKIQENISENMAILLEDKEDIVDGFIKYIDNAIYHSGGELNLYYNQDLLDLLTIEKIDDMYYIFTGDTYCFFRYTVDLDGYDPLSFETFVRLYKYLRLAGQLSFIEFQIYDGKTSLNKCEFSIGTSLGGYGLKFKDGNLRYFAIRKSKVIRKINKYLIEDFASKKQIIRSVRNEDINIFKDEDEVKERGLIYLANIPSYIFDLDIKDDLLESGLVRESDILSWEAMYNLFKNPRITNANFIIHEETLEKLFKGILPMNIGNTSLKDEIILLIKTKIFSYLNEKEKKDQLTIIKKSTVDYDKLPRLILYSDNNKSFYIRPSYQNPFDHNKFYFPINHDSLSQCIYNYLGNLQDIEASDYFSKIL